MRYVSSRWRCLTAASDTRRGLQEAVASEKYDQVLRNSAHVVRHYGLTDEREYFAKLTGSYARRCDAMRCEAMRWACG